MAKHVIDYIMSYAPIIMFKEFSRKYLLRSSPTYIILYRLSYLVFILHVVYNLQFLIFSIKIDSWNLNDFHMKSKGASTNDRFKKYNLTDIAEKIIELC